jgi:hypothetical protein
MYPQDAFVYPQGYAYPRLSTTGLENVRASTSHNPMGLHGLLQW